MPRAHVSCRSDPQPTRAESGEAVERVAVQVAFLERERRIHAFALPPRVRRRFVHERLADVEDDRGHSHDAILSRSAAVVAFEETRVALDDLHPPAGRLDVTGAVGGL